MKIEKMKSNGEPIPMKAGGAIGGTFDLQL